MPAGPWGSPNPCARGVPQASCAMVGRRLSNRSGRHRLVTQGWVLPGKFGKRDQHSRTTCIALPNCRCRCVQPRPSHQPSLYRVGAAASVDPGRGVVALRESVTRDTGSSQPPLKRGRRSKPHERSTARSSFAPNRTPNKRSADELACENTLRPARARPTAYRTGPPMEASGFPLRRTRSFTRRVGTGPSSLPRSARDRTGPCHTAPRRK